MIAPLGVGAIQAVRRGRAALSPKQSAFVGYRVTDTLQVFQGGYRAGKTVAAFAWAYDRAQRVWPLPVLVTEPTYRMVTDVFVQTALSMCRLWKLHAEWHKTDKVLVVGRRRPVQLWCRSRELPRNLEGITAGAGIHDEWELGDVEALVVGMARVSIGPLQQSAFVGTAEGFGAAYELILEKKKATTQHIQASTRDNPHVSEAYADGMAARMSESQALEKIGGIRQAPGGRVYSRFDRAIHCATPCVQPGRGRVEVWCDFNVAPMVWLVVEVDDARRCAHVVGEVITLDNADTKTHAEKAAAFLQRYFDRTRPRGSSWSRQDIYDRRIPAVCDASGKNRNAVVATTHVALLQQAGFVPKYGATNPAVEDRIATVQTLLLDRRLTYDRNAAPFAVKCVEQQALTKSGDPDKAHGLDHANDSVGYGCFWHFPTWKPQPNGIEQQRRAQYLESRM